MNKIVFYSHAILHCNFLQEDIANEFIEKLVTWAKSIKVSDPLEEGCRLGPVVSAGQVWVSQFQTGKVTFIVLTMPLLLLNCDGQASAERYY